MTFGIAFAPQGWALAGPDSTAFHALRSNGSHIAHGHDAQTQHFADGSALLACSHNGATLAFPWPLKGRGHVGDADAARLATLIADGISPADLWWKDHADNPMKYAKQIKKNGIWDVFVAYLAGSLAARGAPIDHIETRLMGASCSAPEGQGYVERTLVPILHLKGTPPHANAQAASTFALEACERLANTLWPDRNAPVHRVWTHKDGVWTRKSPRLFSLAASLDHTPTAHETLSLANTLSNLIKGSALPRSSG